jgi:hypothetical protein
LRLRDEFIPFSHCFASLLSYNKLAQSYADAVFHVTTNLAFEPESLLLRSFGELSLERVLLSAVALLLSRVVTFTFSQSSAFSRLV